MELEELCKSLGVPARIFKGKPVPCLASTLFEQWDNTRMAKWREAMRKASEDRLTEVIQRLMILQPLFLSSNNVMIYRVLKAPKIKWEQGVHDEVIGNIEIPKYELGPYIPNNDPPGTFGVRYGGQP